MKTTIRKPKGNPKEGWSTVRAKASKPPLCGGRCKGAVSLARSTGAFSLPELMVTLVVSGLLVSGIVSGYMVQKRSYEDEANLIDMQMNGRLAMDRVAEIVRSAGLGCKDNFPPKDNQILEGVFNNYTRVFTAVDRNDGPDVLTVVSGLRRRTRVESVAPDHVVLEEMMNPNGVPYFDLEKNRYIFFSPQGDNQYLQVLGVDDGTRAVSLSAPCTTTGNDFCTIRQGDNVFRVNAYTITLDQNGAEIIDVDQDGSVADRDGDFVPDLYIYSNTRDLVPDTDAAAAGQANVSSAEVAEGIEALQFRFGWDANGNGEIEDAEFVDDPTGNEDDVRAVRIYLLSRTLSSSPGYTDPNSAYTLANHTLTLNSDERHYHRQLFVETVMVRNMNL
jgi:prepilin-type N-terminal cleavage/methylation domain-containing protein